MTRSIRSATIAVVGTSFMGEKSGEMILQRVPCRTCGDQPCVRLLKVFDDPDPNGVDTLETRCPKCHGIVQVVLRAATRAEQYLNTPEAT